jgi:peroxiredoxin
MAATKGKSKNKERRASVERLAGKMAGDVGLEEGSDGSNQTPPRDANSWVRSPPKILPPGSQAPDFTLRVTPDQDLSLSDFHGRPLIIAFYPADWSPVCGDQMVIYNEVRPEFQKYGAEVLGISVDGAWCHDAFAKHNSIHFPLLSDFEPKGDVAKRYGAYRHTEGVCERALFVIDKNGVIFWSYLSPIAVNPGADGIFQALEDLQNKKKTATRSVLAK